MTRSVGGSCAFRYRPTTGTYAGSPALSTAAFQTHAAWLRGQIVEASPLSDPAMDMHFSLAELKNTLCLSRMRSSSGPGDVSPAVLCNPDHQGQRSSHGTFNTSWAPILNLRITPYVVTSQGSRANMSLTSSSQSTMNESCRYSPTRRRGIWHSGHWRSPLDHPLFTNMWRHVLARGGHRARAEACVHLKASLFSRRFNIA